MISQAQLNEVHDALSKARAAESAARGLRSIADKLKRELMGRVRNGEKQAHGDFYARIVAGRVYPAWKEEYISALGADAAQAVIERTPRDESLVIDVALMAKINQRKMGA